MRGNLIPGLLLLLCMQFCTVDLQATTARIPDNFSNAISDTMSYGELRKGLEYRYRMSDWPAIIELGNKGLENDFDFYYLRLLMGIAHFEIGSYFSAISHLEAALKWNAGSQIALLYLRASYLETGRPKSARFVERSLTSELMDSLKIKKVELLSSIFFEGTYKIVSNNPSAENSNPITNDAFTGNTKNYGQFLVGGTQNAGFRFHLTEVWTHAAQKVWWGDFNQDQGYLQMGYQSTKNLRIYMATHYFYTLGNVDYQSQTTTQTTEFIVEPGGPPVNRTTTYQNNSATSGELTQNSLLLISGIDLHATRWTISPQIGYGYYHTDSKTEETATTHWKQIDEIMGMVVNSSEVDSIVISTSQSDSIIQNAYLGLGLLWKPEVWNDKIYLGVGSQVAINSNGDNGAWVSVYGGMRMGRDWSLEANYYRGNLTKSYEQYGLIVNNGIDLLNNRFGATVNIFGQKGLSCYMTYQYETRTLSINSQSYHNHSLTAGIKIDL